MAEDLNRMGDYSFRAPWLKIFSAFKVALDPKKLLLAGLGVLAMSIGWALISWLFYSLGSKPDFRDYEANIQGDNKPELDKLAFERFKRDRARFNFRHALAGNPGVVSYKELGDFAELAQSVNDYREARTYLETATISKSPYILDVEGKKYTLIGIDGKDANLDKLPDTIERGRLVPLTNQMINVGNVLVKVKVADPSDPKEFNELRELLAVKATSRNALELVERVQRKEVKPAGLFRVMPWFENRGPNPYLLVTSLLSPPKSMQERSPGVVSGMLAWILHDGWPVLLEPLRKFLLPVVLLFHGQEGGGFLNFLYLVSLILCNIAVWAFFGGAITRIALVQLARNEKVGFTDAIGFSRSRFQYYFLAPVLPLIFLAIIIFFLWVFGLIFTFTFAVGDILAGLLWPIALLFGLIMAVVLVGLVGWPLMNPTISAEGSDSFDGLTRSYSYVFQAPWHYLWYGFLALVYGAVVVFFVAFMGSLLVYLAKWGVAQGAYYQEREPSFLFVDAPTSFGWRDLLLHDSPHAVRVEQPTVFTGNFRLEPKYQERITFTNRVGIFFVSVWLYFFFLIIVGFAYSFFWTAASIIYLLMRKKIDDTEMDEVYIEDEEPLNFMGQSPPPPAGPTASGTPGAGTTPPGTTFTMVEAPALRPASPSPEAPRAPDAHNDVPPTPPPA